MSTEAPGENILGLKTGAEPLLGLQGPLENMQPSSLDGGKD